MKETSNNLENEWNGQAILRHFFQYLLKEIFKFLGYIWGIKIIIFSVDSVVAVQISVEL
jgi:isoprenylcysteine carboxyl methyltransferase (ICMT) family protein YpbQ